MCEVSYVSMYEILQPVHILDMYSCKVEESVLYIGKNIVGYPCTNKVLDLVIDHFEPIKIVVDDEDSDNKEILRLLEILLEYYIVIESN
jgi:hypothetical protein